MKKMLSSDKRNESQWAWKQDGKHTKNKVFENSFWKNQQRL
jgi:hypothetical protein